MWGCFIIWAECCELCDCCDNIKCCHKDPPNINTETNIETNRELQISTYTITSPIQSKCVEI